MRPKTITIPFLRLGVKVMVWLMLRVMARVMVRAVVKVSVIVVANVMCESVR